MCPKAMVFVLASPHSHKCLKLSWKKVNHFIIGSEHSILIWTCSFLMTNEVMTIPHAYDYLGNTGVLLGPFVPFCTKLFAFLLIFKCMKSLKHCRKRKADYKPSSQFPRFQCSLCLPFWAFSSHPFSFLLIVAGWFHTPDGLSYCPLCIHVIYGAGTFLAVSMGIIGIFCVSMEIFMPLALLKKNFAWSLVLWSFLAASWIYLSLIFGPIIILRIPGMWLISLPHFFQDVLLAFWKLD